MGIFDKIKEAASNKLSSVIGSVKQSLPTTQIMQIKNIFQSKEPLKAYSEVVKKNASAALEIASLTSAVGRIASIPVGPKAVKSLAQIPGKFFPSIMLGGVKAKISNVVGGIITTGAVLSPAAAAGNGGASLGSALKRGWDKMSTVGKVATVAAGVTAAAYGIEQLAEAAGVRGGAGFIGKVPTKKRKKSKSKKKKYSKKKYSKKSKRRSKRRSYGTAKQYKRKGGKSVHYTKNGQPYIKLKSGKCRFVKK